MDKDFELFARNHKITSTALHAYEKYAQNSRANVIEGGGASQQNIDVFTLMTKDRILFLKEELTTNIASILNAQLLFLSHIDDTMDITLMISSPGGSVSAMFGIYDTMQFITPDVRTVCLGHGRSGASILLSSGTPKKRYTFQHSQIMIHQLSAHAWGTYNTMETDLQHYQQSQRDMCNILSIHTGKTFEEIAKALEKDLWMTAQQAKDFGIVDHIITRNPTSTLAPNTPK